jgi:hypothetical protein
MVCSETIRLDKNEILVEERGSAIQFALNSLQVQYCFIARFNCIIFLGDQRKYSTGVASDSRYENEGDGPRSACERSRSSS